jgi:hypothetical protein
MVHYSHCMPTGNRTFRVAISSEKMATPNVRAPPDCGIMRGIVWSHVSTEVAMRLQHGYALLVGVGRSAYPAWSLPTTASDATALTDGRMGGA